MYSASTRIQNAQTERRKLLRICNKLQIEDKLRAAGASIIVFISEALVLPYESVTSDYFFIADPIYGYAFDVASVSLFCVRHAEPRDMRAAI